MRELRDEERCGKNRFLGIHVWEFFTRKVDGGGAAVDVKCRLCDIEPRGNLRMRLFEERELDEKRGRLSKAIQRDSQVFARKGRR